MLASFSSAHAPFLDSVPPAHASTQTTRDRPLFTYVLAARQPHLVAGASACSRLRRMPATRGERAFLSMSMGAMDADADIAVEGALQAGSL